MFVFFSQKVSKSIYIYSKINLLKYIYIYIYTMISGKSKGVDGTCKTVKGGSVGVQ